MMTFYLPDDVEIHDLLHPAGDDSIDYVASESIHLRFFSFPACNRDNSTYSMQQRSSISDNIQLHTE